MKFIIMGNGLYGDINFYSGKFSGAESILCADGGANYAYQLGWHPAAIVGDMDSIRPEVRAHFADLGVPFKLLSRRKDETDTQAVLNLAVEMGAAEIIMLGSLGKRLDHTLSNLYSGMALLQQDIKISHLTPEVCVYLVNKKLEILGGQGELVSILSLTDTARGVTISGFEYPLHNVCLEKSNPYAVSNVMTGQKGIITLREGILAVFHYLRAVI
ncbi:MAG: thiamine diphosphokinase [Syntrophomonadaceae bacterium]|nr:thiamine diphosphokinase [Syntrophomonadaceae bacterium]